MNREQAIEKAKELYPDNVPMIEQYHLPAATAMQEMRKAFMACYDLLTSLPPITKEEIENEASAAMAVIDYYNYPKELFIAGYNLALSRPSGDGWISKAEHANSLVEAKAKGYDEGYQDACYFTDSNAEPPKIKCEGAHEVDEGKRICKHCGEQYYHGK